MNFSVDQLVLENWLFWVYESQELKLGSMFIADAARYTQILHHLSDMRQTLECLIIDLFWNIGASIFKLAFFSIQMHDHDWLNIFYSIRC